MTKLTQATTKKLVNTVMAASRLPRTKDVEIESHVIKACRGGHACVGNRNCTRPVTPKNLGKMFLANKGNKTRPTPLNFHIRRVVGRLRGAGVLVTPERKKSGKAVSLPKLEQLKALAHLDMAASAEFADAVLLN